MSGWIGVDLDGTLAHLGVPVTDIGAPVPVMVRRVKAWLAEGRDVRIMTARVATSGLRVVDNGLVDDSAFAAEQRPLIEAWCLQHIGCILPLTATKDFMMAEIWDDRAVQVVANTGEQATEFARRCGAGEIASELLPPLQAQHSLFVAALLEPHAEHHDEPLHQRVERECWKQHPTDFVDCDQPACVLLKRLARALGWTVGTNGVQPV